MKNIFKLTLATAAIAVASMGAYKAYETYVTANMSNDNLLLVENIVALAQGEANQPKKGFGMNPVWYASSASATAGVEVLYEAPGFLASLTSTWTRIDCCVRQNDYTYCDFSGEDSKCSQILSRS